MNVAEILEILKAELDGLDTVEDKGNYMFFYNPDPTRQDRRLPFTTIVSNDAYDSASDLGRPSVYRINIGVPQSTYKELFGSLPAPARDGAATDTGYDYSQLDHLMPHPTYAAMGWICVLNPSQQTWGEVLPLIKEAYGQAKRRRRPDSHRKHTAE